MRLPAFIVLGFMLALSSAGLAKGKTGSKQHAIVMEAMTFSIPEVTIPLGDTVEWTNNDLVPHTVTSLKGAFDSKAIAPGAKWIFHSKKKGTFKYKCSFHPTMAGTLIVQ